MKKGENIMISVVIPLYNKERVLWKTLDSVLVQNMKDFEVIIVNDGSTDNSRDVLNNYCKQNNEIASKITIIDQANTGVSAARNTGIKNAKYDYIAFLDADDLWDTDYLSRMIYLIKKYPQCAVFASSYKMVYDNTSEALMLQDAFFPFKEGVLSNYFKVVASKQPFYTSSVVVCKTALEKVDMFPIGVKFGEDLIVWAKLAVHFQIAYWKEPLVNYVMTKDAEINSFGYTMSPISEDYVGKELVLLKKQYNPIGIADYIFMWYKIRFVMSVFAGKRFMAWNEYIRMMPKCLSNLDCYYHLALTFLPVKWYGAINKRVVAFKRKK